MAGTYALAQRAVVQSIRFPTLRRAVCDQFYFGSLSEGKAHALRTRSVLANAVRGGDHSWGPLPRYSSRVADLSGHQRRCPVPGVRRGFGLQLGWCGPRARRPERRPARRSSWLHRMAISGSRAGWALRAARAITRPEPIISDPPTSIGRPGLSRSEEHTSELQSLRQLACR